MLVASTMLAQQMMRNGTDRGPGNGMSWGMVITMIVLVLLVLGVIVWAVIYASRRSHAATAVPPTSQTAQAGPTPREILDQRYARGEIDTADYEDRRTKLG